MRTTLTLDDDVAAALKRLRKKRDLPFKEVVNEALRLGLDRLERRAPTSLTRYQTEPWDLGEPRLKNLDCLSEVLAVAEGERFK
jgi:hypothetical protein